ncbi:MAG: LD-carboxypeptidase [Deltaproteobacteria bacterium]|nr:LD-carboxypeptidase [Deltaproteobacteria bacterium]
MTLIPPRVERGQTIGVVAPAGPIKPPRLAAGLARLGDAFRIRLAPSLETWERAAGTPSYLAAPDEQRAGELMALLADPDVRAVVLARGGYGLMRLLPALDPDVLRRDPKPIVGFSDATALLAWAHHAGVRGIHGPMIGQLADLSAREVGDLIAMLGEPVARGVMPWRLAAQVGQGVIRGPLVGANLTMISMLAGTRWPVPVAGAIALVEEVGEKPYELDRYLTQLILTGVLPTSAAWVLGDLVRCTDPHPPAGEADPSDAALRVFVDRLGAAGIPFTYGAPVGHGTRNEPVPFGAAAELDLDTGTLAILDAAVS